MPVKGYVKDFRGGTGHKKRRLLTLFATLVNFAKFQVCSRSSMAIDVLGVCILDIHAAILVLRVAESSVDTYSAWTSVVFLLQTGIAKTYESVKNRDLRAFLLCISERDKPIN